MTVAGFPHSDILGSRFVCQLPEAYRRLQRPSSAPSAKASTLCPYKLDHKDHSKMLASTVQFSSNDRDTAPHPGACRAAQHRATVHPGETARRPNPRRARPQAGHTREATPRQQPTGCSLRTQQRAKPTPADGRPRSLPTPKGRRTRRSAGESRP